MAYILTGGLDSEVTGLKRQPVGYISHNTVHAYYINHVSSVLIVCPHSTAPDHFTIKVKVEA